MRILVTGASGMLGSNIAAAAVQQSWDVLGAWHAMPAQVQGAGAIGIDLTDRAMCVAAVEEFAPDAIVHAAIGGDPSRFERESALGALARAGVEHTLSAARAVRARYVLVSCDWVFSGLRPPHGRWEETDTAEPVNAYGHAHLAAERLVRGAPDVAWLIARVGDPYGVNVSKPIEVTASVREHGARAYGARAHGERRELSAVRLRGAAIRHMWERSGEAMRIVVKLREGRPVPAPADVRRSPTYAWDLGQRLCELIAQEREGVYHTAGPDSVHRREYIEMIARAFGCDPEQVIDGDIAFYLRVLGETRELPLPPNTALDTERSTAALGRPAVDVEAGLWLMSDQLRRALAR